MEDRLLLRYSRQLLLPEIDLARQERLLAARLLLVGAGGLGSPAALYLAGSGVGQLTICDGDAVELSNLHRQILHRTGDIGRNKAESAADTLADLNPEVRVLALNHRLEGTALQEQIAMADVVIDGSDNFPTRYALNAACRALGKPLVSGAVIGWEGQATVFRFDEAAGPCLACLYPPGAAEPAASCSEQGILAPVAGVIGSLLALEALKILLAAGDTLCGRLLRFDARSLQFRIGRFVPDPQCRVCRAPHVASDPASDPDSNLAGDRAADRIPD